MSSETNKAAVRRCWEETWNLGNVTLLDELYSPDSVHHFGAKPVRFGPDQRAAMVKAWRTAGKPAHMPGVSCVSPASVISTGVPSST